MTDAYSPLADHTLGVQMNLGRVASIVIAIVAAVGVFVEIPIVSDYAFWVMTGVSAAFIVPPPWRLQLVADGHNVLDRSSGLA